MRSADTRADRSTDLAEGVTLARMDNEPVPVSTDALPDFLDAHANELPDAEGVRGILWAYRDTRDDWREHPQYGAPFQGETPSLEGPPTLERLSGILDGLFIAMQWLALPLEDLPDYEESWRPAPLSQ